MVKENPMGFYKYIKGKRITRERIGPFKDQQGHLRVELQEMGEILSKYLASVFTMEKDVEARELEEVNSEILKNVHITDEEVLNMLKYTKVDKSLGSDQGYPRTLWETREVNDGPLAEIFVSSTAT
eukprot:g25793.t1